MAAILLALTLAVSSPALAQDDGGNDQTSNRASDSLQGANARIIEETDDGDGKVDRIEITAADCQVDPDATITIEDVDPTSETFTNGTSGTGIAATIKAEQDRIVVDDISEEVSDDFGREGATDQGTVAESTGIVCGSGRDADDDGNGNDGDGVQSAGDLLNISCEDLLGLFRSGTGQYGDAALFADPEVRERVEKCLEEEVVADTAADDDLPDTGGVSLLWLAVLGAVAAVAALAVIRPGRTEG
jgi:hypothetical protein